MGTPTFIPSPITLESELVRLEPLSESHVPALLAAAAEDPALYAWVQIPQDEAGMRAFVAAAEAGRRQGEMLPFATVRRADGVVVGSTRFARIERWDWPPDHPWAARATPDVTEIGYTWLAASAARTAVNTEAKTLMITHAFDVWDVHRVALRTDRRNDRSRAAIERLGARFEGIRRADRTGADGTVRDSAVFSIVADEWPAVRSRLQALCDRR